MTLKDWLNACFSGKVEIEMFKFALSGFTQEEVGKALEMIANDEIVSARFKELSADENMRNKIVFFVCIGNFIGILD